MLPFLIAGAAAFLGYRAYKVNRTIRKPAEAPVSLPPSQADFAPDPGFAPPDEVLLPVAAAVRSGAKTLPAPLRVFPGVALDTAARPLITPVVDGFAVHEPLGTRPVRIQLPALSPPPNQPVNQVAAKVVAATKELVPVMQRTLFNLPGITKR